jgi:hypothetical protein
MGEGRGVDRVLVGRPKGKRPLERPTHRWEDNIKMDYREIGINGWVDGWMDGWINIFYVFYGTWLFSMWNKSTYK